jgi:hypothetical protein
VTTTADSGAGSLREAINAANARVGADRIVFSIPANDAGHVYYTDDGIAGQVTLANVTPTTAASDSAIVNIDPDWPHSWFTIAPTAALPAISDSVTINGYTQGHSTPAADDDARVNTNTVESKLGLNTVLRIEINGTNAGSLPKGILEGTAGGIAIQGLAINRTAGHKIYLGFQTGGNFVAGNFLGPDISGTRAFTPAVALDALVALSLTEDVIGGTAAEARNLISGNTGSAFQVAGIFSNGGDRIEGNLIGTDKSGTRALPNARGIYTGGASTTLIGGSDPNATNTISGNANKGVEPREQTIVQNNFIGTDVSGRLPLGNGVGVETSSSSGLVTDNRIQIIENRVAFNGVGIRVVGNGNLITRNSIFLNSGFGIEFDFNEYVGNDVPPASDPPDQDTGPNTLQNHPVLDSVTDLDLGTRIQGTLESTPNSMFRLEFFANPEREEALISGALPGQLGEGQTHIGSLDVTTNATGVIDFSVDLPVNLLTLPGFSGQPYVTATATNITSANGHPLNNTSQFSPVEPLGGPSVIVTNTHDTGIGSLREAIFNANLTPNRQVITFAMPASDPRHFYYKDDGVAGFVSVAKIAVTTAPADAAIPTTGPDAIDPDWPHSWFSIQPTSALPEITDTLMIDGYSQPGASQNSLAAPQGLNTVLKIELSGAGVFRGIGLDLGVGEKSIAHQIRGLAINQWLRGIDLDFSAVNQIAGNFIGSDVSGTIALGNSTGVWVEAVAAIIGGLQPADRNLISGNTLAGVTVNHFGGTSIQGNLFGAEPSGNFVIGTGNNGLSLIGTTWVTVGGDEGGASNVFALYESGAGGITVTSDVSSLQKSAATVVAQDLEPCLGYANPLDALFNTAKDMGELLADLHEIGGNNDDFSSVTAQAVIGQLRGALDYFDKCKQTYPLYEKIGYPLRKNVALVRALNLPPLQSSVSATAFNTGRLAIDIDADGITLNDRGDVDEGAFGGQNYPVLTSATNLNGGTQIIGTLDSLAEATFQIDLFSNSVLLPSGYGPGETALATITVTTNSSGNATFSYQSPTEIPAGRFITSLATQLIDLDSNPATPPVHFETSEFSAGIVVEAEAPWYNAARPLDVNNDQLISAIDVLLVINYLNAFGSGPLPSSRPLDTGFLDTNDDKVVSALDVLLIINFLNSDSLGEGEPPGRQDFFSTHPFFLSASPKNKDAQAIELEESIDLLALDVFNLRRLSERGTEFPPLQLLI